MRSIEARLRSRSLVLWSSDTLANDWTPISSQEVLRRALSRLQYKRKGALLLHDIQPRMVLMLPMLLTELKRRRFKIVHVVPDGERPMLPVETMVASASNEGWPRVLPSVPRATTGSSSATPPPEPAAEEVVVELPLPRPRPPIVHHASIKPPVVALRDLHAAQ